MKNLQKRHAVLSLIFFACFVQAQVAMAWGWGECEYSRDINKSVSVNALTELSVLAGAGTLKIVGDGAQKDIRIKAKMCASEQQVLDEMNVASELGASAILIKTVFPKKALWGNDHNASIDLELFVPARLVLDVEDSSGEASVEGVAKLSMVDSSGRLQIDSVAGDLKVVDSSGELLISNVGGDVNVRDSSGAIIVSKVAGSFVVEVDSSGAIEAQNIGKNVLVKVDSSGAIDVSNVDGDFTVLKDSSGGITHKGVKGKVSI